MKQFQLAKDFSQEINSYLKNLKAVMDCLDIHQIQCMIEHILNAYHNENFIYVCGNGGSASTASHLLADFNKVVSFKLDKKFRILCLNDNIPIMLAISNDTEYREVFRIQLENYIREGDLFIGISASGNSPNVLNAVNYANEKGAMTIGLVGFDGGNLKKLAKHSVHVPISDMQQVEDMHLVIQHLIVQILMDYLDPQKLISLDQVCL